MGVWNVHTMNILYLLSLLVIVIAIPHAFAEYSDIIIVADNKEYEISEITKERKLSRNSQIMKIQGYTTTGEMFFLRISPFFEKVMILDTYGQWLKAELKEIQTEEIIPENITIPDKKTKYVPDLMMTESHDFRTYWKETFNIDVQAFDGNRNPNPTSSSFEGRLDGVDVKVLLSINDETIATLSGVTKYGEFKGEHYFDENISAPGEYTIDIILTHLGKTVSKTTSMFVIGTVTDNSSSDPDLDRDDDGILNNDDDCPNDAEDFLGAGEDAETLTGDGCPEPQP